MVDIIFKGKVVIDNPKTDQFLEDFKELLDKHSAYFHGSVASYEFDDCEVIEPIEEVND